MSEIIEKSDYVHPEHVAGDCDVFWVVEVQVGRWDHGCTGVGNELRLGNVLDGAARRRTLTGQRSHQRS